MGYNIEDLKRNYAKFSDEQIIRLATEETTSLRPEALKLLKEEIKNRNLPADIFRGIEAQFKEVSIQEVLDYCEVLRKQPCPVCNSTKNKLNATITGSVMSFIVMTNYEKVLRIACPQCLDTLNKNAMIKSAILGWWGMPWGIIRTVQALWLNNKMQNQNWLKEPNNLLRNFVIERIGQIETNKNNPEELQAIIRSAR